MRNLVIACVVVPALAAAPLAARQQVEANAANSATAVARAKSLLESGDADGARAALEQTIEADPDCVAAHDLLREVAYAQRRRGSEDEGKAATAALLRQYEAWCQRFPQSCGAQFGLGALLSAGEDPRARPHLLEAVRLRPTLAAAWQMLSADAERWGEQRSAREYMERAAAAEPDNPDYAFYAAYALREVDLAKWVAACLDLCKRFPASERGAQALYWLAERADSDQQRIAFAEQAREQFPPERFGWTESTMSGLFDAYLRTAPARALALAVDMEGKVTADDAADWKNRRTLAEQYIEVHNLLGEGKAADAAPLAAKMSIDRFSSNTGMIALLKADVTAQLGDVQAAYDSLLERMAVTPEDAVRAALVDYGNRLGRSDEQVDGDVRVHREARASAAPSFELRRYDADRKTALADYRGKVVLLTFWFPGCGPCRGEFPNFEHVLAKFRGEDVAYVGINTVPEQDDYVVRFMAGTRYTFTPLRGEETTSKDYGVRGCPTNFLIDQAGRIVYRNFRIYDDNEILLQRMIESLLEHPPTGAGR